MHVLYTFPVFIILYIFTQGLLKLLLKYNFNTTSLRLLKLDFSL